MTGRLTLVELRRYVLRAGVRWLVVGMLAVVVLTAFSAWRASRAPSQAELDQARAQYEMAAAEWAESGEQMLAQCRQDEAAERQRNPGEQIDFGCDDWVPVLEDYVPSQATFAESGTVWVAQVAIFVLLLSLILGATFVAAEFSTGAISTWLTFEPRRVRVFVSKALVVTLATGLVALVVAWLAVAGCLAATAVNDSVGQLTPEIWADLGNRAGRIAAGAAGATLVGAVLGFLLRHTAAAIGVVVGWFVAIDGLLVQGLLRSPRWAVTVNLQAWLDAGTTYYQQGACTSQSTGELVCADGTRTLSMASGGLTLVVLVAALTALALLVFRRRDVA